MRVGGGRRQPRGAPESGNRGDRPPRILPGSCLPGEDVARRGNSTVGGTGAPGGRPGHMRARDRGGPAVPGVRGLAEAGEPGAMFLTAVGGVATLGRCSRPQRVADTGVIGCWESIEIMVRPPEGARMA